VAGLTEPRRPSPPPGVTARHSYLRRRLAGVTPPPRGTGDRRCAAVVHALGARAPTPGCSSAVRSHSSECARRRGGRRRYRHLLRSTPAATARASLRKRETKMKERVACHEADGRSSRHAGESSRRRRRRLKPGEGRIVLGLGFFGLNRRAFILPIGAVHRG
jgi:hypothetical protein